LRSAGARDSLGGVRRPFLCASAAAAALAACVARAPPPPAGARCLATLDARGVRWEPAAPGASLAAGCAVDTPVRVSAAAVAWNQPGIVACRFALTLESFTEGVVDPLALEIFGEPVRTIRHFGTYACRATHAGRESLHASGEAIDIAGFELADGRVISVERDWRRRDSRGAFLHAVARAACRSFSVVLTPDSDADHFNHIHLDAGPYRLCGSSGAPPESRAAGGALAPASARDDHGE